MAHRCEHLCSTSQLWLPHLALCIVLPECFWGLCIWSGAMGSKSSKFWNVADCDNLPHTLALLFALHFPGLSPLSDFLLTLDPLPATTGNPALVQRGPVPIPAFCITKSNPCSPHEAHLPSLPACTTHIAIQRSGLAVAPCAKV